ncbi:hypothetical protein MG293_001277 [Ovis ammon polii]|uniref:Ig-like domain-containing protein n=1 Tax=Ovis ammon polii TaxID=230172 RepID=A0AAD4UPZ9_OVIAM|nr:hypothetical protein MG293_001277 [Ovis ammon polii]KAI4579613.1 hypothetical protein MJT46_000981 [Ovis ammon polii x Ovis aries]
MQLASLSCFYQHPESVKEEPGGVTCFQRMAWGVPEPSRSWEHEGMTVSAADHSGIPTAAAGARDPVWGSEPEGTVLECIATGHPRPLVSWSHLGGCSISLEGIHVLGPGNLVISEVLVQHSSTYVCAVNRPETQIRRWHRASCLCRVSPKGQLGRVLGHPTRHGNLDEKRSSRRVRGQASWHLPPAITCLAPSEFVQWPQSLSKPPGSSTIFICVAQGVPESWLVLLKNGKGLSPGDNIRLTYNSQLVQSSKRLWVKVPFEHVFSNLEPTTVYSIHVRAYSAEGLDEALNRRVPLLSEVLPQALSVPVQTVCSRHNLLPLAEPATLFEVKLQAFSGNGDGKRSSHVVSRHNVPLATPGGWDPVAG